MEFLVHRTGWPYAPQNSMRGLEYCAAHGAEGIEGDVTFIDGEPFLWLDEMWMILRPPHIPRAMLRADDMPKLHRSDCNEGILHVDELWEFLERHPWIRVYFDVKFYDKGTARHTHFLPDSIRDVGGYISTIPDELVQLTMDRIVKPCPCKDRIGFTTFRGGLKLLAAAKEADERIATDYIMIFPWERIGKHAAYLSSVTIGWKKVNHWNWLPFRGEAYRIMDEARSKDLKLHAGIVNTWQELLWAIENGADGVWVDNVQGIRRMLEEIENEKKEGVWL